MHHSPRNRCPRTCPHCPKHMPMPECSCLWFHVIRRLLQKHLPCSSSLVNTSVQLYLLLPNSPPLYDSSIHPCIRLACKSPWRGRSLTRTSWYHTMTFGRIMPEQGRITPYGKSCKVRLALEPNLSLPSSKITIAKLTQQEYICCVQRGSRHLHACYIYKATRRSILNVRLFVS